MHRVGQSGFRRLFIPTRCADDARGVELDDGPAQPAELAFIGKRRNRVRITIHEGRYHQVKRMFEAVGHPVRSLHRERFGDLTLGNLQPGQWRELTPEELRHLVP